MNSIKGKTKAIITAFALETHDGENEAKRKMQEKETDFMVLNYANEKGAGFDSSTNRVTIFSKNGGKIELKKDRKDRIAQKIIDFVLQFSNQPKLTK
jgi:phosphopantothenoylcysteine decarboxylase/phosphopantothenate--cysteine ligase